MVGADTVSGAENIATAREATGLSDAERQELVKKILKAEKANALERLIDEEIRRIEAISPPPPNKATLIDRLRGVKGSGNIQAVMTAISEARTDAAQGQTEALADSNLSHDYVAAALKKEYGFDDTEIRRLQNRARAVNCDDPESVRHFAEAMVDNDVPKEMRPEIVKGVEEMVKSPVLRPAVERMNASSEESRVIENAKMLAAQKASQTVKDPKLKEKMKEATDVGAQADPAYQQAAENHKKGKISDQEMENAAEKSKESGRERIAGNIRDVKAFAPEDIRRRAEAFGSDKEIADRAISILREQRKAKEAGKPEPQLNKNDLAALHLFYLAREKAIIERLSDNVVARDLERGQGTEKERIDRAVEILKKESDGQFKHIPDDQLRSIAGSVIKNADQYSYKIDTLGQLQGAQQKKFYSETLEESAWGNSLSTAAKHVNTGLNAMLDGDEKAAKLAALHTGRGAKNILERKGFSKETAQTIGGAVTSTLEAGAAVGVTVVETAAAAANAAKEAANTVQSAAASISLAVTMNSDMAKQLEALKKGGWADIKVGNKKLFDTDGNGQLNVEEIKKVLAQNGVNLSDYDKDKSGNLSGKELTNAMDAAYKAQMAQLNAPATPTVAAKAPDQQKSRS